MNTRASLRNPWIAVPVALVLLLITFLVIYIPAGALTRGLHLSANATVPVTILITFAIACLLMAWHIRRGTETTRAFGVRWPRWRYLGYALIFAVPVAVLAAWATAAATKSGLESGGPLAGLRLAPWQPYVYFVVAAAVQEEAIFRGLLQSTLARRLAAIPASAAVAGVTAMFCVALLFGLIHLVVGPVTAVFAFALAVIAGELRRRSGSLLPAIICHSVFNLAGILWTLHG